MLRRRLLAVARPGHPRAPGWSHSRVPGKADRGQSLVEFALMIPVFFLLLFGAFDFGLWMFTIGSARFAAADAARVEALGGNTPGRGLCGDTCARLKVGQNSNTDCDGDCQALVVIAESPLVTSSFAHILEVDVFREKKNANGTLVNDTVVNRYDVRDPTNWKLCNASFQVTYPNGSARTYCDRSGDTGTYSTASRNVIYGQQDYLKLDIVYEYDWKTGFMYATAPVPPELHAVYTVQLEPKTFP